MSPESALASPMEKGAENCVALLEKAAPGLQMKLLENAHAPAIKERISK